MRHLLPIYLGLGLGLRQPNIKKEESLVHNFINKITRRSLYFDRLSVEQFCGSNIYSLKVAKESSYSDK